MTLAPLNLLILLLILFLMPYRRHPRLLMLYRRHYQRLTFPRKTGHLSC